MPLWVWPGIDCSHSLASAITTAASSITSGIARPMQALTLKGAPWKWANEQQQAFERLKAALVSSPVLALYDPEAPTKMETDASDGVLGGVLSQLGRDGWLLAPGRVLLEDHGRQRNEVRNPRKRDVGCCPRNGGMGGGATGSARALCRAYRP
jgi:hypothetical protein